MTIVTRALWIIERHPDAPLTLCAIARACGVSRHHLAHAFSAATGTPLMHYVRGRRLTGAAAALANGAPDILGLALDAGYESHEAFSRAFKARFGTTPEAVRRRAGTAGLPTTDALALKETPVMTIEEPRFQARPAMLLIGLPERRSLSDGAAIAGQWASFMARYHEIAGKAPSPPVGVSVNMDDDGTFDYVCAAEVAEPSRPPAGMTALRIPPRTYAVFTHRGHVATLPATYDAIWNAWFPASTGEPLDGACLERHLETFDPRTGLGGVEIWIPVKNE